MPTGYTADIKDGIDFKTYAMNCARAFGACVTLRDETGGGDKIPDSFAPSDYHLKELEKVRAELAALEAMTMSERMEAAAQEWDDAETRRLSDLEDSRKTREAYEAMLAKVNAWTPPTPEHVGLHDFMRTQIEASIRFDCMEDYYNTSAARLTDDEWVAQRKTALARALDYHEKEHRKEVERAKSRTAWVAALRASLITSAN